MDEQLIRTVPPQLVPHVHLVSNYTWPRVPQLGIDSTIDYLLEAPRITREISPMTWTFLDAPPDGSIILVWTPESLSGHFASDGYVWADPEERHIQQIRDFNIEIYIHKSGFRPGQEAFTSHSRHRYRLTPSPHIQPHSAPCDRSLWLVHYSRAHPQYQIPVNRIPLTPATHAMLQNRMQLQRFGGLIRKDFMLHDQSAWPIVNLPPEGMPLAQAVTSYPANVISHINRNQQAYAQGHVGAHSGPPPPKRTRQSGTNQRPGLARVAGQFGGPLELPEGEDKTWDQLDTLSPREISQARYMQHQEWMEEVFASPYASLDIKPVSLGFGRKGLLAPLTNGYFQPPRPPTPPSARQTQPGKQELEAEIDAQKVKQFADHVSSEILAMEAEMKRMKDRHEKEMAKIKNSSAIQEAEAELRKLDTTTSGGQQSTDRIERIVRSIENVLRKRIVSRRAVVCIEKGGLEDRTVANKETDVEIDGTGPHVTDPQDVLASETAFDGFGEMTSIPDEAEEASPSKEEIQASTAEALQSNTAHSAPESSDWVMVDANGGAGEQGEHPEASNLNEISENYNKTHTEKTGLGADIIDFSEGGNNVDGDGDEGRARDDFTEDFGDAIDFSNLETGSEELLNDNVGSGGAELSEPGVMEESVFGEPFQSETGVNAMEGQAALPLEPSGGNSLTGP